MQQLQQFAIRIQRGDEELKRLQELCAKNKIDFKAPEPKPTPAPKVIPETNPPVKPVPK